MKHLKILIFTAIVLIAAAISTPAQLRAYTFEYSDEFGGKQKCYLTLRAFDITWDKTLANVLFNCYESETMRTRNVEPRRIFILTLKGGDFLLNVGKPIDTAEQGNPRAIVLSNWLWDLAETTDFIDDYSWSETERKMIARKKSLIGLKAVQIDIPLDALQKQ